MRIPRIPLTAAYLAFALLACGEQPESGRTEIRFVTWKPNQPEVWDAAIERFEQKYPDLRVVREVGPHSSTALHDLLTQKLKNRDPSVDVFFMDVVWPAEFAAAGWARALDRWFTEEDRTAFLPGTIRANTWRGRIYGVPAFIDAGMLYYRADLLKRYGLPVPTTWHELLDQARKIVESERSRTPELVGYTGQFKQYEGIVCDMLELVASNRGSFVDEQARHSTLTDPETLQAIRFVRDELIGSVAPRSVLTYQEPESLAVFIQGHAVFHRNWPYAWEVSNNAARSRIVGRVGVAPLPHFEGGESVAALGGWQYGMSPFSRHPEAAWAFVRFMTGEEMQRFFALQASLAPTREALYTDPQVLERNPRFAEQAAVFKQALPRPVTPVYPAVSEVLQRFLSSAIVDRESDLEGLAREASVEIDRLLGLVP
ncbi:MAG: ABC transporter substrate-binding protein [Myxococcota bacterium]